MAWFTASTSLLSACLIFIYSKENSIRPQVLSSKMFWTRQKITVRLARGRQGDGTAAGITWPNSDGLTLLVTSLLFSRGENRRRDGERCLDGKAFVFGQAVRHRTDWFVAGVRWRIVGTARMQSVCDCSMKRKMVNMETRREQTLLILSEGWKLLWNYIKERSRPWLA